MSGHVAPCGPVGARVARAPCEPGNWLTNGGQRPASAIARCTKPGRVEEYPFAIVGYRDARSVRVHPGFPILVTVRSEL